MNLSAFQFRMRTFLVVIACCSVGSWLWVGYFSPVHRWGRTILSDNESPERWEAADRAVKGQIPGLSKAEAISALCFALTDSSYRVRQTAASNLGRFRGPQTRSAVPHLVSALKDADKTVRLRSAQALGFIDSPDSDMRKVAVPALVAALDDKSEDVRIAAGFSLTLMGRGDLATSILTKAVREGRDPTGSAVLSLGLSGSSDHAAFEALTRAAQGSSDPRIKRMSADALERRSASKRQ